jgi:hypothetical protein
LILLEAKFVASDSKIDLKFLIQVTFTWNVSKHKSFYIQLNFSENQFYKNQLTQNKIKK